MVAPRKERRSRPLKHVVLSVTLTSIGICLTLIIYVAPSTSQQRRFVVRGGLLSALNGFSNATPGRPARAGIGEGEADSAAEKLTASKKQKQPTQSTMQVGTSTNTPKNNDVSTNALIDFHSSSIANLGLFPWEIESVLGILDPNASLLEGVATCNPPAGVPENCCLGSFSMGGEIDYKQRTMCGGRSLEDYDRLRIDADLELDQTSDRAPGCDVCRIIELSRRRNLTISIFGDSMMNQVVTGLSCELSRRGYEIITKRKRGKNIDCKTCIKGTVHLMIISPTWGVKWQSDEVVHIYFMFQYRYPFWYKDEEETVAKSGDVLVINFGLHWAWEGRRFQGGRGHYKQSYSKFLKALKEKGTFRLLAHRETSAQHFDADGGDWGLRLPNASKGCVPMNITGSEAEGWRETYVKEAAEQEGYRVLWADHTLPLEVNHDKPELIFLPFWNYTSRHYNMHPSHECSHYCASPFLYTPLWRSLRLAMDRTFG